MATITRSAAIKMVQEFQRMSREDNTDDLEAPEDQMDPESMSNEMLAEQITLHDLADESDDVDVQDDED